MQRPTVLLILQSATIALACNPWSSSQTSGRWNCQDSILETRESNPTKNVIFVETFDGPISVEASRSTLGKRAEPRHHVAFQGSAQGQWSRQVAADDPYWRTTARVLICIADLIRWPRQTLRSILRTIRRGLRADSSLLSRGRLLSVYGMAPRWRRKSAGGKRTISARASSRSATNWQWDFYSYWMEMRGSPPRGQCWGNSFIHDETFKVSAEYVAVSGADDEDERRG